MNKYVVMTDSGADITTEVANRYGIKVVRLPIIVDGQQFLENDELTTTDLVAAMKANKSVKTSSPLLGNLISMWDELLKEYQEIIYIPLSSNLSGTYAIASAASKNYDGKITVIDAKMVCYPLTVLCIEVNKMLSEGLDPKKIKEIVEEQAGMWACLMPENLTALANGGRISPAVAAIGNMLKIVPLLKVENGAIDLLAKVRTTKKAYSKAIEIISNLENPDDYDFYVVEAQAYQAAQEMANTISGLLHREVPIYSMQSIIMCHTGPGTVACGYMNKLKY